MANFFDLKARKAAAAASATGEGSSKSAGPKVDNRLQPWVEK
jgi:replication factor C subunit 2/4